MQYNNQIVILKTAENAPLRSEGLKNQNEMILSAAVQTTRKE